MYTLDDNLYKNLDKRDLIFVIECITSLLPINTLEGYKKAVLRFANNLDFEYSHFSYIDSSTGKMGTFSGDLCIENVNSPQEMIDEYVNDRHHSHDPVRSALITENTRASCIEWDSTLKQGYGDKEQKAVELVQKHNMNYGYSAYDSTLNNDFILTLTFASEINSSSPKIQNILKLVAPHFLNSIRIIRGRMPNEEYDLTPKETEVLQWVKEGKTNWEIGIIMNSSESTVKFHMKNILTKLNASNRQQAVAVAISNNLIRC